MPAAAVLFLQAQHDGAIYGATGQHAAGFWLSSWRGIAAGVGDALHDDRPLRQFTVSPLLGLTDVRHGVTRVAAGDMVDVDLELDAEPRTVTLPDDFAAALDGEEGARRRFDGLSYSHQRQHVLAIEDAKTPETRQRRIDKALAMLREGRK